MKKITLFILILFTIAAQRYAFSQIVTTVGSAATSGDVGTEVNIPVTAALSSSIDLYGMDLYIYYNEAITTITSVTEGAVFTSGFTSIIDNENGKLTLRYFGFGGFVTLLSPSSVICTIKFKKVSSGTQTLSISVPDDSRYSDINGDVIPSSFISGTLEFQGDAPHTIAPVLEACPGASIVSVPVIVDDFITIGAVSLTLQYSSAVLTYVNSPTVVPGFTLSIDGTSTPGYVSISGFSGGVTYPDGTTLFTLKFTYNGGYTDLAWIDDGGSCQYANQTASVLPDIPFADYYTNGSVGPAPTTWDGSESTVWSTLGNWSCDVPTAYTDVIIGTSSNYPVIPAAADITVKSLTINAGSVTVSPTAKLTVTNTLTNTVGSTGLVLKSDATGTGSLINNTAGVAATIERFITGSENLAIKHYHLVSHPFTGSYLSGVWMDSYLFDCDEPTGTWIANGGAIDNPLLATKGYMIYYPGTSKLYSHTGTLQTGTSTIPVTNTSGSLYPGYNLVPNLYPCALDFDVAGNWGGGVISNTIWIWNASSGNYGAHIRSGGNTNGVSNIIPEGQGFFVQATSSGNLTIDPAARVHNSSQAFLKNTDITENMFRLKASGNNFSDEIVIQFREDASAGYDELIEAKKMTGQSDAPQLSSIASDDTKLSINSLPFSAMDAIVPLNFTLNATTDITFDASGMESFFEGIPIYLEDHLLNTVIDLRANPVYQFSHKSFNSDNRFALRFVGVTDIPESDEIKGYVYAANGQISINVPSMYQLPVTVSVFDAQGRLLSNRKTVMNGNIEITAPSATGVYLVRVLNGSKTFTGRVLVN